MASGGNVVIADPGNSQNQRFLQGGHENSITVMAVSKPGDQIATGGHGRAPDVIVWDFKSGQIQYRLQEHDYGVSALGFSTDGRCVCVCVCACVCVCVFVCVCVCVCVCFCV